MLIAGAGNLGIHILDELISQHIQEIAFFDERSAHPVIQQNSNKTFFSEEELMKYFAVYGNDFIAAVGHPRLRKKLFRRMCLLGGSPSTVISKCNTLISGFSSIGAGSFIQAGCVVSHDTQVGEACIIHSNTLISHGVRIGQFVTIGPNVTILKNVVIDDFVTIEARAIIRPGVKLAKHSYVTACSDVCADLTEFQTI